MGASLSSASVEVNTVETQSQREGDRNSERERERERVDGREGGRERERDRVHERNPDPSMRRVVSRAIESCAVSAPQWIHGRPPGCQLCAIQIQNDPDDASKRH
jgi:hypothetical protein